ncbi:MAG: DUF72 domain-containing protein [Gammaproteobacteria bacterium]|nr:DUF72 domain-containing protein [Gammaproteobacteria bacterium]
MGEVRIGTSGYQYDHWRGILYPECLAKRHWFEAYTQRFDTVEINNTFYRLPDARVFERWREAAPPGFLYALKFSRYGSHRRRLLDPQNSVTHFIDVASRLEPVLGPILVQLPPRWDVNVERLDTFLAFAPRRYRWAVEVRDPRWLTHAVFATLARHGAALCIHDHIKDHPREITSNWVYLRYHGAATATGSYSRTRLAREADFIRDCLGRGRDVYAYFNNDQQGHAVRNALQLKKLMSS